MQIKLDPLQLNCRITHTQTKSSVNYITEPMYIVKQKSTCTFTFAGFMLSPFNFYVFLPYIVYENLLIRFQLEMMNTVSALVKMCYKMYYKMQQI